ncbi:DUF481 domain-containing protein [Xinfangfangia sp. CPCC 101601]|uniref:DUF481 domain-containing protein n=1 Tax=Pseudogemmobacter lacusdianii TaxID=3069608 RepID=A0ABU0VW02_9RHOB|nr:DUF481 domain-containing protein [Xinfangfangia sp. CPCC 101601]MDQ2065813.1 DUF481 domain-containing protein [Xinfangfangia sp. CPCC 101601]
MKAIKLVSASVLALAIASPTFAQSILVGADSVDDRIDDIERDVSEDMARANDSYRYGQPEGQDGLTGSVSLGFSGKTGNNESQDLAVGFRIRHVGGPLVQTIGAVLDFQESDVAGVTTKTKEDIFVVYDANYYVNDRFYIFGLARLDQDGLAQDALVPADAVYREGFIGVGPGYRIINTPDMTWRVQAGVGISYTAYGDDTSVTESAGILGSRFYSKINENVFLTNDTDIIDSDVGLRANNDFGVNVKLSDTFSTRISYLTEYNESRAIRTDNRLGVSLVMGF